MTPTHVKLYHLSHYHFGRTNLSILPEKHTHFLQGFARGNSPFGTSNVCVSTGIFPSPGAVPDTCLWKRLASGLWWWLAMGRDMIESGRRSVKDLLLSYWVWKSLWWPAEEKTCLFFYSGERWHARHFWCIRHDSLLVGSPSVWALLAAFFSMRKTNHLGPRAVFMTCLHSLHKT